MQRVQPFSADEAEILKVWPTLGARCTQKSIVMRRDSLALLTALPPVMLLVVTLICKEKRKMMLYSSCAVDSVLCI